MNLWEEYLIEAMKSKIRMGTLEKILNSNNQDLKFYKLTNLPITVSSISMNIPIDVKEKYATKLEEFRKQNGGRFFTFTVVSSDLQNIIWKPENKFSVEENYDVHHIDLRSIVEDKIDDLENVLVLTKQQHLDVHRYLYELMKEKVDCNEIEWTAEYTKISQAYLVLAQNYTDLLSRVDQQLISSANSNDGKYNVNYEGPEKGIKYRDYESNPVSQEQFKVKAIRLIQLKSLNIPATLEYLDFEHAITFKSINAANTYLNKSVTNSNLSHVANKNHLNLVDLENNLDLVDKIRFNTIKMKTDVIQPSFVAVYEEDYLKLKELYDQLYLTDSTFTEKYWE